MNKNELCGLHIVSSNVNADFEQRESGELHMSYAEETAFYSLLQQGNVEAVKEMVDKYMSSGIFVGRLSDDPLMQDIVKMQDLFALALHQTADGDSRPAADDSGNFFFRF